MKDPTLEEFKDLPGDIKRKIAIELSPPDLVSFCMTNKKYNADVCNDQGFWRLKLQRDFPYRKYGLKFDDAKDTYMKEFLFIGKEIDTLLNRMKYELMIKAAQLKIPFELYRMMEFKKIYKFIDELDKMPYDTYEQIYNHIFDWVINNFISVHTGNFIGNVTFKLLERKALSSLAYF